MYYLRVVGDFLLRPYEAFENHKGRHLWLSIVLAMLLSALPLFLGAWFLPSWFAGLMLLLSLGAIHTTLNVAVLHIISRMMGGKGSWQEFLSVYGFTSLPLVFPSLAAALVLAMNIPKLRNPALPGVLSSNTNVIIPLGVFTCAMQLAALVYAGLALGAVYRLQWRRIVGVLLLSFLVGSLVNISFVPTKNVSWEALALMVEGVDEVHMSFSASNTLTLKQTSMERGELVLVQLRERIYLRTAESANTYYQKELLAELVAVSGDTVALEAGALLVNGVLKQMVPGPLPHLTLPERRLGNDEYLVYFTSPTLFGTETNPELFVIHSDQIVRGVEEKSLAFIRWIAR